MSLVKTTLSKVNKDQNCYIVISDQNQHVRQLLLPLGIHKKKIRVINGGNGSPMILEYNNQEIVIDWEVTKTIEVKLDDSII